MQTSITSFYALKNANHAAIDANLWEVANKMSTLPINLGQNIEQKRLNIEVKSLMIKEQFCKQAQVLAV